MKQIVKVVRHRNTTDIHAFVSDAEIGAKMDLETFINLLVDEYGNPTTTLTKAGLKKGLINAKNYLIEEMKKTTVVVASENLADETQA